MEPFGGQPLIRQQFSKINYESFIPLLPPHRFPSLVPVREHHRVPLHRSFKPLDDKYTMAQAQFQTISVRGLTYLLRVRGAIVQLVRSTRSTPTFHCKPGHSYRKHVYTFGIVRCAGWPCLGLATALALAWLAWPGWPSQIGITCAGSLIYLPCAGLPCAGLPGLLACLASLAFSRPSWLACFSYVRPSAFCPCLAAWLPIKIGCFGCFGWLPGFLPYGLRFGCPGGLMQSIKIDRGLLAGFGWLFKELFATKRAWNLLRLH